MGEPDITPTVVGAWFGHSIAIPKTAEMRRRRVFIHLDDAQGVPDGAIVDWDGCYWLAQAGGWRIARYTPLAANSTA
jgi:sugar lactone lactonase YvrE